MKKLKLYLDTSVISHLKQDDVPDKMADTLQLWEEIKAGLYEIYISNITITEIMDSPIDKRITMLEYLALINYNVIDINDEMRYYASKLNETGILSDKHYDDCLHIACAVICDCDYLLSWNFKHIVKVKTINGVRSINATLGYKGIDIFPPNLLIKGDEE